MPSDWDINVAGNPGLANSGPPGAVGVPGAGYIGTSTTNLPIATGPITITTQVGLAYQVGARLRMSSNSAPSQWMEGQITAYTGTQLTVNIDLTNAGVATAAAPVLLNYLGGLTLSNDATSPTTVLDIATGSATSDDNSTVMSITVAGFKKNCNAPWAVGSGNGALDTGSTLAATTWYHVYVIMNTTSSIVDVLISMNATTPTMPTGYTKKRRIGSIKTNASNQIIAFLQNGDLFLWSVPVNDYTSSSLGTTAVLVPLSVPLGVRVQAIFNWYAYNASGVVGYLATNPDIPAQTYGVPVGNGNLINPVASTNNAGQITMLTNTSSQIRMIASAASSVVNLATVGWIDIRGK